MIHIPIEERYNLQALRNRQMLNSSAWVIAGTVISVGAAAAGTAISTSAANKAAKAQGAAGKKFTKQQQKAQAKLVEQLGQIQAPQWDLARDISEAGQITDYNVQQLEQIFPGARNQRDIAAQATTSYLRGEIPKDVQDQIMRSVAELGGAGFAPTTVTPTGVPTPSGFQSPQGLLARQLGLTSLDLQMRGQDLSQRWQAIAGSFIESPLQVGQARLGYEKAAADIQMAKAQAEAGMAMDVAKGSYGVAVDTIGSRLAASQALASGITTTGMALGSGISSYGMAGALASSAASQGAGAAGGATGGAKYGTPEYTRAVTDPNTLYLGVGTKAQQQAAMTDVAVRGIPLRSPY